MTHDARACRITRVTTYVVGMRWRNCVFAQVETDEGISGIGEGSLEYQPKAVEAAIQQLAVRYAIGRSGGFSSFLMILQPKGKHLSKNKSTSGMDPVCRKKTRFIKPDY